MRNIGNSFLDSLNNMKIEQKETERKILEENTFLKQEIIQLNQQLNSMNKKIIELNNESLKVYKKELGQLNYCNMELLNNVSSTKQKILIIGFYGALNLGDELMLETLLEILYEKIPDKDITVMLCDNEKYDVEKYGNIKFIHYPKTLYDFNRIAEQYDYFIFGGGAIIDDKNYNLEESYRYDLGTILIKISMRAIAFDKKVIVLGVSSSAELKDQEYIKKLEYIIDNCLMFSVRDTNSYKLLKSIYNNETMKKVSVISDLILANKKIQDNIINNQDNIQSKLKIGIIWICTEESIEKLCHIIFSIENTMRKNAIENCEINLIPFYSYLDNDNNFYKKIDANRYSFCKINIEKTANNFEEIIQILKKNDLIISLRYHGILLSYAMNMPCIPICYDIHPHYYNKICYLTEIFNKEDAIKYSELDSEKISEKIIELMYNKKELNNYNQNIELLENSQKSINQIIEKYLS